MSTLLIIGGAAVACFLWLLATLIIVRWSKNDNPEMKQVLLSIKDVTIDAIIISAYVVGIILWLSLPAIVVLGAAQILLQ